MLRGRSGGPAVCWWLGRSGGRREWGRGGPGCCAVRVSGGSRCGATLRSCPVGPAWEEEAGSVGLVWRLCDRAEWAGGRARWGWCGRTRSHELAGRGRVGSGWAGVGAVVHSYRLGWEALGAAGRFGLALASLRVLAGRDGVGAAARAGRSCPGVGDERSGALSRVLPRWEGLGLVGGSGCVGRAAGARAERAGRSCPGPGTSSPARHGPGTASPGAAWRRLCRGGGAW